jgi:hypothetical protein
MLQLPEYNLVLSYHSGVLYEFTYVEHS